MEIQGNTALKQHIQTYGSDVTNAMMISDPNGLVSYYSIFKQLADSVTNTNPELKGKYLAARDFALSIMLKQLEQTASFYGAPILITPNNNIYSNLDRNQIAVISEHAKAVTSTGLVSKILNNGDNERETKVIPLYANKDQSIEINKNEVEQAKEPELQFHGPAENNNIEQASTENESSKTEEVLPNISGRVLSSNASIEEIVEGTKLITSIHDLNSYFKNNVKPVVSDLNIVEQAYIKVIQSTVSFIEYENSNNPEKHAKLQTSFKRLQGNLNGIKATFKHAVINVNPETGKKKKELSDTHITYNDMMTAVINKLSKGDEKAAHEFANLHLRSRGTLIEGDNTKVMPNMSDVTFKQWFHDMKQVHFVKPTVIQAAAIDTKAYEKYEDVIDKMKVFILDNKDSEARRLAYKMIKNQYVKSDGSLTPIFEGTAPFKIVSDLILELKPTGVLVNATETKALEMLEANPEIEKEIAVIVKTSSKVEIGQIKKIVNKHIQTEDIGLGIIGKIGKLLTKRYTTPTIQPELVIAPVIKSTDQTLYLKNTTDISDSVKIAFDKVVDEETANAVVIELLDSNVPWQEVLNGMHYAVEQGNIESFKDSSDATIDIWFTAITSANVAMKANKEFDKPIIEDAKIVEETINTKVENIDKTITTEKQIDYSTYKAPNKDKLQEIVLKLLKNKELEEAKIVVSNFPKFSNWKENQISDYIHGIKRKHGIK